MSNADQWAALKALTPEQQHGMLSYLIVAYGEELAEAIEYARLTWPSAATMGVTPTTDVFKTEQVEETVFDWATDVPELALPSELRTRAVAAFFAELLGDRVPSIRAIKDRLQIGQPKATQLQAYLTQLATA